MATNIVYRIALAGVCTLGLALGGLGVYLTSKKGEKMVEPTATGPLARPSIPPIDASTPAQLEKATFALG